MEIIICRIIIETIFQAYENLCGYCIIMERICNILCVMLYFQCQDCFPDVSYFILMGKVRFISSVSTPLQFYAIKPRRRSYGSYGLWAVSCESKVGRSRICRKKMNCTVNRIIISQNGGGKKQNFEWDIHCYLQFAVFRLKMESFVGMFKLFAKRSYPSPA